MNGTQPPPIPKQKYKASKLAQAISAVFIGIAIVVYQTTASHWIPDSPDGGFNTKRVIGAAVAGAIGGAIGSLVGALVDKMRAKS